MKRICSLFLALCIVFSLAPVSQATSSIVAYNFPTDLPSQYKSTDFSVTANTTSVDVYNAGDNAWGSNIAYSSFEFSGAVTVSVTTNFSFSDARILPRDAGISCTTSGNTVTFTLNSPQNVTVLFDENFNGRVIHIFAQAPETDIPDPNDSNVMYFGPGYYDYSSGEPLRVESNKTLYLAPGAVLRGRVLISDSSNVTVCGRGIILNDFNSSDGYDSVALTLKRSNYVTIRDIIIARDAAAWSAFMWKCGNVTADYVKVINPCYACSDGFDIANSHDVTFDHMFIRSADDSIAIKGTGNNGYNSAEDPAGSLPNDTITIRNTQIWSDTNNALGIGQESVAAYYKNITFSNIDILYNFDDHSYPDQLKERAAINIGVLNATSLSDITFENIRVEQAKRLISIKMNESFWFGSLPGNWSWDGEISGITFKDITSYSTGSNEIQVFGHDADHTVSDVTFKNIKIRNELIDDFDDRYFRLNSHARNIKVVTDSSAEMVINGPYGANVNDAASGYSEEQGGNNWYYRTWTAGVGNADMVWNPDGTYHWRGNHSYDAIWMYDNTIYLHPDTDQTMLEWVATDTGKIRIKGNVRKYDVNGGDGVVVSIWKNGELVWPASGWQNIAYNDAVGIDHDFIISVSSGDIISFRVDEGENNGYDTTIWDTTIIYDDYI